MKPQKSKYLTLEEVEKCANAVLHRYEDDVTIRNSQQYSRNALFCRYAYYKVCRMYVDYNSNHIHKLVQIAGHIGFNHATINNAFKSMESLVISKDLKAIELFGAVEDECANFLKKKYENNEITRECKSLLAGIYAI